MSRTKVDAYRRERKTFLSVWRGEPGLRLNLLNQPCRSGWLRCPDYWFPVNLISLILNLYGQTIEPNKSEAGDMHTRKRRLNPKALWGTIGLVGCLLVPSFSSVSQTKTKKGV